VIDGDCFCFCVDGMGDLFPSGPNGMNKLVVNHLEKIIVSSDCATIVKELEVQHPAAKMLVLAAEMQETEYGDNTNFVRTRSCCQCVKLFLYPY